MRFFKYILFLFVVCLSVRSAESNKTMADINIGSININRGHNDTKRASDFKLFKFKKIKLN